MFKTVIENLPMVFSLLMGMGLIVLEVFLPGFGLPGIGHCLGRRGNGSGCLSFRHADSGRYSAGHHCDSGVSDFVGASFRRKGEYE
ncbi:MAG: hypothetical protein V8Q79_11260 [Christensenellales bacterium]